MTLNTTSSISRAKAVQNFDKIWDHGMLIEGFKFDHETQRKLDRFKEFLFENLSYECLNDATGPKAKE